MNNLFSLNQVQCHQHCANLANHSINSPCLSFFFFFFFTSDVKSGAKIIFRSVLYVVIYTEETDTDTS